MIGRLIVMRHAKSSWQEPGQADHDRPLNLRGQRDAPLVAQRIVELGWSPRLVLSSNARRTRETYALMEPAFSETTPVEFLSELYLAGLNEVRHALAAAPYGNQPVLVLGHNPGWEEMVQWCTDDSIDLPTGCAVLMESESDGWQAALAKRGRWRTHEVIRPREL